MRTSKRDTRIPPVSFQRAELRAIDEGEETHLETLLDLRGRVRAVIMLVLLPEGLQPLLLSPLLLQLLLLLPELRSRKANLA